MTMKGKEYEKELHRLQVDLCKLQEWVKYKGLRVIIVFERARCCRQGRYGQGTHRAGQPADLSRRRPACAL